MVGALSVRQRQAATEVTRAREPGGTVGGPARIDGLDETPKTGVLINVLNISAVRQVLLSAPSPVASLVSGPPHQIPEAWLVRVITPRLPVQLDHPQQLVAGEQVVRVGEGGGEAVSGGARVGSHARHVTTADR